MLQLFKRGMLQGLLAKATQIHLKEPRTIAFADGDDDILKACDIIKRKKIAKPLIVGDSDELMASIKRLRLGLDEENVIDPQEDQKKFDSFVAEYQNLKKGIDHDKAVEKMSLPHYYSAMLVHQGEAHGMISGFTSKTKPYYPVFEIIGLAKGVERTSGAYLMVDDQDHFIFADCVMNINPSAEVLAEIALLSSITAKNLGFEPRVAMLSFSTRNSAKHELVDKVKSATELVKKRNPKLIVDGEIQVDAALIDEIAEKKAPDSPLKGKANVLIFPDLNSGNIAYKLVEWLGGFRAIGPILQGIHKPANDLSRGATVDDVVCIAAVTVLQSTQPEESLPTYRSSPHKVSKFRDASKKKPVSREEAYQSLPSNIRKIIEESKAKK